MSSDSLQLQVLSENDVYIFHCTELSTVKILRTNSLLNHQLMNLRLGDVSEHHFHYDLMLTSDFHYDVMLTSDFHHDVILKCVTIMTSY